MMAPPALATLGSGSTVEIKQIEATHCPDGGDEDINSMSILVLVKGILDDCNLKSRRGEVEEGGEVEKGTPLPTEVQYDVNKLSILLGQRSSSGEAEDAHTKTNTLFNMVSTYSWDVKVALILAAYISIYGRYHLLAQTYNERDRVAINIEHNKVAINMAALLTITEVLDDEGKKLKLIFEPLHDLVSLILDLCGLIVEIKKMLFLNNDGYCYLSAQGIGKLRATIIVSCYWIIRSLVTSMSYMQLSLFVEQDPRTTSMKEELGVLRHKIQHLHDHLQRQFFIYYNKLDDEDKFELMCRTTERDHVNNMMVLKLLLDSRNDRPTPIFDMDKKEEVGLGTLKDMNVHLFIISNDDDQKEYFLLTLIQRYHDWSEEQMKQSGQNYAIIHNLISKTHINELLKGTGKPLESEPLVRRFMVLDPQRQLLESAVTVRFIEEKLNLEQDPILVTLDTKGRILHINAIPMIITLSIDDSYGCFPLSMKMEESLRQKETWNFELFKKLLRTRVYWHLLEGKSICLYGGDDMKWIREFTAETEKIAHSDTLFLKMGYVGMRTASKLLYIYEYTFDGFWAKIQGYLLSRAEYVKRTSKDKDDILQGLEKLLDMSGRRRWALFIKGNDIVLMGEGSLELKALEKFDEWKKNVEQRGFEGAMRDYYETIQSGRFDRPCCRLYFDVEMPQEGTLESIKCPECHQRMNRYTTLLCYHL